MAARLKQIFAIGLLTILVSAASLHRGYAQEQGAPQQSPAKAQRQEQQPKNTQEHPLAGDAGSFQPRPDERNPGEAEQKGGHGGTEEIKNSPAVKRLARIIGVSNETAYWIAVVLNFAVIVIFIAWVSKKSFPGIFKARNDSIKKRIEEARKTSEEARRRLSDVESRLSRLDSEIEQMRREAEESAQAEEKRIQAEVEEERRRILKAAEQEIDAAAGAARRDLKAYAAELAVNLAAKKIKVGPDADQKLVREFTAELGKDGN
jgi:F-type H+-transporting ATPase subunit b